jgi:replication factor C subunit 3/5
MFLVDKYTPKSIEESKFNNDFFKKMSYVAKNEAIPHILICGPPGSGKKTAIKLLLEMLYDSDVNNMKETVEKVIGSGNKPNDVIVKQSNYHIVVDPTGTNFDRYIIQCIVKKYAQQTSLGVFRTKKVFRTVLINNLDNMSYYAQTSLRRTMEKYSRTCRFIMWCTSSTRVIDPIISRCIFITLKSPTNVELTSFLFNICFKEKINLSFQDYNHIIKNAKGNIKEALWILEMIKIGYTKEKHLNSSIEKIANMIISQDIFEICKKSTVENSTYIRDILYNMQITNISGTKILNMLLDALCENNDIPEECKLQIIEIIAHYEFNVTSCRRIITQLEPVIIKIMQVLYTYSEKHKKYKEIFSKYKLKNE